MNLRRLFSKKWLLTTILVFCGMGVLARLGFWQLDRLAQRRALNSRVEEQLAQPMLQLDSRSISDDLTVMEYRSVVVQGEYDFSQEIVLRNQVWGNLNGVHLLTPLQIDGTDEFIIIDRGWIPAEDAEQVVRSKYQEPGAVEVRGVIRLAQVRGDFGRLADPTPAPGAWLDAWYFVNIEQIAHQMPYHLLPVYVQQSPDPSWTGLPYRSTPDVEITEGPHLGYAIQWFTFATILGAGYPFFVRREEQRKYGG